MMRRARGRRDLGRAARTWVFVGVGCVVAGGALPAAAAQFPCTEQGIRDAIAAGGGPHTFACVGPTTVATATTIVIDNDVVLDGEDDLTVDGNDSHTVFSVAVGVTAELRNLTVRGGNGGSGGGILNTGTLDILNATITSNSATAGGGIYNGFAKTLTLTNSIVSDNTSTSTSTTLGGGGIYNTTNGSVSLAGSEVVRNFAQHRGAGVFNFNSGTLTLVNSIVSDNQVLDADGGSEGGGGIYHTSGTVMLVDSTIARNSADVWGGGGLAIFGGTVTITGSTISDNAGADFGQAFLGGGIWNDGAVLTLTNSTLSGNSADFQGGGSAIFQASGSASLASCTIADNGLSGSGAIHFAGGSLALADTIVANPNGQNCTGLPVASGGGNVESPGNTCGFTDSSDQVNVSAASLKLGPLADNGGPTQTHALGPGSVAIDAAVSCPPPDTDQRGVARPQLSACDSGAYELGTAAVPALSPGALGLLAGLLAIAGGAGLVIGRGRVRA